MYEKSVAGIHKIYTFISDGSFKSVYDSLSANDQAEIDALLEQGGGTPRYTNDVPGRPVVRMVVDGYVKSSSPVLISTNSDGSSPETATPDVPYPIPVINWIRSTYIAGTGGQDVIVRIFFS